MKTGLESLDTGAPEITYSGNQGPKSPQEDQRMMQEFQMEQMAGGENDRVRELLLLEETQGLSEEEKEELRQLIKTISAQMPEGGLGDMPMDMDEPKMEMPEEMREMAADGGIMRAAFQGGGRDAGAGSNFGSENFGGGGDNNREQYGASGQYTRAKDTSFTKSEQDRNQRETIARNIAANKEIERQKEIDRINESIKEAYKNPFNKAIDKFKPTNELFLKNLIDQKQKTKTASPGLTSLLNIFNPTMVDEDYTYDSKPTEDMLGVNIQDYMDTNYGLTGKNMTDIDRVNRALDQGRKTGNISQAEFESAFFGPKGKRVNDNRDGPPIILPRVMPMTTGMTANAKTDIEDKNKFELRPNDFVSRFSIPNQFRLADGGRIGFNDGNYVGSKRNETLKDEYNAYVKEIELGLNEYANKPMSFSSFKKMSESDYADGGRIGYAGGGITDLRQGYFLGKLVKKATKGIKKIVKSPLGKAALLYFGANYFGRGRTGMDLFKNPLSQSGKFLPAFLQKQSEADIVKKIVSSDTYKILADKDPTAASTFLSNAISGKSKAGLGTLAAIVAPAIAGGLYTKKTEEDQPTLDEAMAQTSRGSSPFDQYGGVSGFRDMIGRGNLDKSLFPFLQPTSYAANGGRIGYDMGGIAGLRSAALNEIYGINDDEDEQKLALGGSAGMPPVTMMSEGMDLMSFPDDESTGMTQATPTTPNQMPMPMKQPMMDPRMMQMMMAQRGNPMMNRSMMQQPRIMAQEGGMMDMGGMEKDYRNEGGFVPIGGQERADDVPARLSKNEFVFTADAVRNAGGGDIDKGAEIMENMMENLEQGGKVSKGSQGLKGAREMFATQQRLGEVL